MSSTNRALAIGVADVKAGDSAASGVLRATVGERLSSGGLEGTKKFESQPGNTASAASPSSIQGPG